MFSVSLLNGQSIIHEFTANNGPISGPMVPLLSQSIHYRAAAFSPPSGMPLICK